MGNQTSSKVEFLSITTPVEDLSPEGLIARCARVSSPNPTNPNIAGLLRYCIREGHWSIFEMVDMTLDITTTLAIAPQLLRHKSFSFQQYSLRYAEAMQFIVYEARRQDEKNRQNSIDDLPDDVKEWFENAQIQNFNDCWQRYKHALSLGIAKECARNLLPLNTATRMHMKGSVRSWIHYFQVRCHPATQLEHREIALMGRDIFMEHFPIIAEACCAPGIWY
jgi:thymidylate synthase (FAD)